MKWQTLAILILCGIPVMTLAEGPTTRPLGRPGAGLNPRGERPFIRPGQLLKEGAATPAELEATEQFLKENLPNRYDLFSQLRAGSPMRAVVLDSMARRYRLLLRCKEQDPDMYQQLLKEARLEDDAINLVKASRGGDSAAESSLREKCGQIVDLWIEGRQARIANLEQALKDQKEKLAYDMDHRDDRINEKVRNLRKQFDGLFDRIDNLRRRSDKPRGINDRLEWQDDTASAGK